MPPTPRRPPANPLKALAAPAMLGVAALLLIPGVWAVLLLAGVEVPNAQRDGARTMAVAMLIAWPIVLLLAAMAGFVWWSSKRR